jgi:AcrR family transcriptional regulator
METTRKKTLPQWQTPLREKILVAASQSFGKQGERLSLRTLAKHIGCSPTAIYLHFENKDALISTVVAEDVGLFLEAVHRICKTPLSPRQRIVALGWALFEFGETKPHHYELIFGRQQPPPVLTRGQDVRKLVLGAFEETLNEILGNDQQAKIRIRQLADCYFATLHGVISLQLGEKTFDRLRARNAVQAALELLGEFS